MDTLFTLTEEVLGDYGILTLTAGHATFKQEYDLTREGYEDAVQYLIDQHFLVNQADIG